jgi:hypothetical protein
MAQCQEQRKITVNYLFGFGLSELGFYALLMMLVFLVDHVQQLAYWLFQEIWDKLLWKEHDLGLI